MTRQSLSVAQQRQLARLVARETAAVEAAELRRAELARQLAAMHGEGYSLRTLAAAIGASKSHAQRLIEAA